MFKLNIVVILLIFLATFVTSVPVQYFHHRAIYNRLQERSGPFKAGIHLLEEGASRRIITNQVWKHVLDPDDPPPPHQGVSPAQKITNDVRKQIQQEKSKSVKPSVKPVVPKQIQQEKPISVKPVVPKQSIPVEKSPILSAVAESNKKKKKKKRPGNGGAAVDPNKKRRFKR